MMPIKEATERAQGMLEKGELPDIAAAQVAIVRMMGVRLIRARLPVDIRNALRAGVKMRMNIRALKRRCFLEVSTGEKFACGLKYTGGWIVYKYSGGKTRPLKSFSALRRALQSGEII